MTRFRPCIDLHQGQVKQIVGSSLSTNSLNLKTNFISPHSPAYFASLYQSHALDGGHLIQLGPNNSEAAHEALNAWPKGLQVGGGITIENAQAWLDAGASKIIVTSFLFPDGQFSLDRLKNLSNRIGKEHLVVDLR